MHPHLFGPAFPPRGCICLNAALHCAELRAVRLGRNLSPFRLPNAVPRCPTYLSRWLSSSTIWTEEQRKGHKFKMQHLEGVLQGLLSRVCSRKVLQALCEHVKAFCFLGCNLALFKRFDKDAWTTSALYQHLVMAGIQGNEMSTQQPVFESIPDKMGDLLSMQ